MKCIDRLVLATLIVLSLLPAAGCEQQGPIKLGFVAGLTGRTADLGIAGRNGVLFAVEEINAGGGINGRQVKLVVKDDRHDPETAKKVDRQLIAEGVSAIIGHMTSQMSVAVLPLVNQTKIVMLSPTTSTNLLNNQDDNFFRIYPSSRHIAAEMAGYARRNLQVKNVLAVYDLSNRAHTESYYKNFAHNFEGQGGIALAPVTFTSGSDVRFHRLAKEIVARNADSIFILANAIDTAMLCQQLRKLDFARPILATEWSGTEDLVYFGGAAVDGLTFFHSIDRQSTLPRYLVFKKNFTKRFGHAPGFAAVHGYDATNIILTALKQNPDSTKLKQTLLQIGTFNGLQGPLKFDDTGDIHREMFLVQVEDGEFRTRTYP